MNKVAQIPERPSRASLRRLVEKLLKINPAELPIGAEPSDFIERRDMLKAVEDALVAFAQEQEDDIRGHVHENVDGANLNAYDCFDTLTWALGKMADTRLEEARAGLNRLEENDLPLSDRMARRA